MSIIPYSRSPHLFLHQFDDIFHKSTLFLPKTRRLDPGLELQKSSDSKRQDPAAPRVSYQGSAPLGGPSSSSFALSMQSLRNVRMQNNHGKSSWDGRLRKKGGGEHHAEPTGAHFSPEHADHCVAVLISQISFGKAKIKRFTHQPWHQRHAGSL